MLDRLNFIKLWSIHLIVYFLLLTVLLFIRDYNDPDGIFHKPIALMLAKSPLVGLYGLLDGIGFLVFISIAVMYLINLYFKKFFFSYSLSLVLTYPFFMYFCNEGYGSYWITSIGLTLTIVINGVIFRKEILKNI
jgi:hypothetical protein